MDRINTQMLLEFWGSIEVNKQKKTNSELFARQEILE